MEAGKLRHLVTIEEPNDSQNAFGEPVEGWKVFGELWASREDLTGRELYAAQRVRAEVTTRFVLRFVDGISARMRVLSDGVTYNLTSVADPDGKRRTLVLMGAREG